MTARRPRVSISALGSALGSALLAACGIAVAPPPAPPVDPAAAAGSSAGAPGAGSLGRPVILSAHFTRADDRELGGKDAVLVIFDAELDAASLEPRAFLLSLAIERPAGAAAEGPPEGAAEPLAQRPALAEQAILAPASEDDENRSVLLLGEFGDATPGRGPTHVAVVGALHAEDGRSLQGLGAPVEPFDAAPRVVATQVLPPAPGRCEGVAQVLRTYWTDALRGVEPDDLPRVRVRLRTGTTLHPVRFDDHATDYDEAGQDHVLDLCVDDPAPIDGVSVEAAAFRDPPGHASAAVDLRVGDSGAPIAP